MGDLGNVYLIEEENGDIYKVYIKLNNTGKSKQNKNLSPNNLLNIPRKNKSAYGK